MTVAKYYIISRALLNPITIHHHPSPTTIIRDGNEQNMGGGELLWMVLDGDRL